MQLALALGPWPREARALPGINALARHLAGVGHQVTVLQSAPAAVAGSEVRVVGLPALPVGWALRAWSFARAVERHLSRRRYDVVLGLGGVWSQDVCLMAAGCLAQEGSRAPRSPRAWLQPGQLTRRVAGAIERRALRRGACRQVITGSMMVREEVLSRYELEPASVHVVYGGVDLQSFHPRLREGPGARLRALLALEARDVCILFPGEDLERDGLEELLEAFALIAPVKPATRLLVAADGPARPRLEQRAAELGIRSRTRFLAGRIDAEACYGAADLCVLPTRYAPFAASTLEALACGVPVVTTCTNGASELITPGLDGSVLPRERAPAALVQELLLWCEPGRAAHGRDAARSLAELHGSARPLAERTAIVEGCAAP